MQIPTPQHPFLCGNDGEEKESTFLMDSRVILMQAIQGAHTLKLRETGCENLPAGRGATPLLESCYYPNLFPV